MKQHFGGGIQKQYREREGPSALKLSTGLDGF